MRYIRPDWRVVAAWRGLHGVVSKGQLRDNLIEQMTPSEHSRYYKALIGVSIVSVGVFLLATALGHWIAGLLVACAVFGIGYDSYADPITFASYEYHSALVAESQEQNNRVRKQRMNRENGL